MLHLVIWFLFPLLPYQDTWAHISRAFILQDILFGPGEFKSLFAFDFSIRPYMMPDLLLALLLTVLTPSLAGCLWMLLGFMSMPLGILYYANIRGARKIQLQVLALLSLLLGTSWFLLVGYIHFVLSVGMFFLTLGIWEHYLKSRSLSTFVFFLAAVCCCYLTHLAGFFFLCICLGTLTTLRIVERRLSPVQGVASLTPPVCIGLWALYTQNFDGTLNSDWVFRQPGEKLIALATMFFRFNPYVDTLILLVSGAILFGLFRIQRYPIPILLRESVQFREYVLLCSVILLVYTCLPVGLAYLYDIDERALPFLFAFITLAGVELLRRESLDARPILKATTALAGFNIIYLSINFASHNTYLSDYRDAVQSLQPGKTVLPVNTHLHEDRVHSSAHAAGLYSIEKKGLSPYLFTGSKSTLFRYLKRKQEIYAPPERWYLDGNLVNWQKIKRGYDYVLVTKPYDASRIQLANARIVVSNPSVDVFKISQRQSLNRSSASSF